MQDGIIRFSFGLGKKVVLADPLGVVADHMFGAGGGSLDFTAAWVGAIAYSLQIFMDFSGYSDMAIGLGKMLGLSFPENFEQPYRSVSLTKFWRRWHKSLTAWFHDYIYVPLGENRGGGWRTAANLCVVFLLFTLWHVGAPWGGGACTILIWGLYHTALLTMERLFRGARLGLPKFSRLPKFSWLAKAPALLSWSYCQIAVIVGWVIFRANTLYEAGDYLHVMAGGHGVTLHSALTVSVLTSDKIACLAAAGLIALAPDSLAPDRPPAQRPAWLYVFTGSRAAASAAVLLFALATLSAGGVTPFIFFKF
jgi:alginate O-acetyltransferase complex protein AlgI